MPSSIPRTSGIYQWRCVPTGKIYVGSSLNLQKRRRQHLEALERRYGRPHENSYLQHAWDKYGADAFVFEVLELVAPDRLLEREQYWIDTTRCFVRDRGFNRRLIAESDRGVKRSEQGRANMRAAQQRRDPATRSKHTPESKAKLSASRRGMRFSDTHRENLRLSHLGHKPTPESRAKRSETMRQRISELSPEQLAERGAKISASKKGIATASQVWVVINPGGDEATVTNLRAFCEVHGLHASSMYAVAAGKTKTHKGWRCRRVINPR